MGGSPRDDQRNTCTTDDAKYTPGNTVSCKSANIHVASTDCERQLAHNEADLYSSIHHVAVHGHDTDGPNLGLVNHLDTPVRISDYKRCKDIHRYVESDLQPSFSVSLLPTDAIRTVDNRLGGWFPPVDGLST